MTLELISYQSPLDIVMLGAATVLANEGTCSNSQHNSNPINIFILFIIIYRINRECYIIVSIVWAGELQNLARLLTFWERTIEISVVKVFHQTNKCLSDRAGFTNIASETLIRGVSFKLWQVEPADIEYQYQDGHTLSLYLRGGETTYRSDNPQLKGATGKLCLMPKDHLSRWTSLKPIRIAHLYLPEQIIRQDAERCLDIDARFAELRDVTYQDDCLLRQAMVSLINALNNGARIDPLFAEEALNSVSCRLLHHYRQSTQSKWAQNKGLSLYQRKRMKTYIKENLSEKLTIELLAELIHLSPFHFARMFKESFGDSPANFIIRQRITLSKDLLRSNLDLCDIASECGFSHQSHFNNYFKKNVGVTPAVYRKLIGFVR